ncbi:stimulated by retinoic acid gene 8 protein-like isoform X2 [Trichomycterus rosablanca]|uniref:stimulated by retinoic acid gene 8 protein-like isoform X2 n=1 Tax=Trichomycterus rosablanca TaxID=2290929 RepID=UPI002F35C463
MSGAGWEKQKDCSEQQKVRRRALQARHRATLSSLFETLKNTVCPLSQTTQNTEGSSNQRTHAKWKILDHAKGFLLEKEAYLSKLLVLKEVYLVDAKGPKNLEEVREQYRRLYSKGSGRQNHKACVPDMDEGPESSDEDYTDEEVDELSQSQSSGTSIPNIQEFEGYLLFYRETLELLLSSGVLSQGQVTLPVVSEAISGLWSSLSPQQRAAVRQRTLEQSSDSWDVKDNNTTIAHFTSVNSSGPSTLKEDLLQDACDVVQRDLDAATANSAAVLQKCDYERLKQIYRDILSFIRSHMADGQELTQDLSQEDDYEELFLRCSESFDEDF